MLASLTAILSLAWEEVPFNLVGLASRTLLSLSARQIKTAEAKQEKKKASNSKQNFYFRQIQCLGFLTFICKFSIAGNVDTGRKCK